MSDLHSMIPAWTASAFASYRRFRALGLTVAQAAAAATVRPEVAEGTKADAEVLLRSAELFAGVGDGKWAELNARRAGVRKALDQESTGG